MQAHLLTSSSMLKPPLPKINLQFLKIGTCRLKSALVGTWKSTTLHILVGHQNGVGWQFVLIYMWTPPTHYFLESPRRVVYMKTCPYSTIFPNPRSIFECCVHSKLHNITCSGNQNAREIIESCGANMDAWYKRISVVCDIMEKHKVQHCNAEIVYLTLELTDTTRQAHQWGQCEGSNFYEL